MNGRQRTASPVQQLQNQQDSTTTDKDALGMAGDAESLDQAFSIVRSTYARLANHASSTISSLHSASALAAKKGELLEAQIQALTRRNSELEQTLEKERGRSQALEADKQALYERFLGLKKTAAHLEAFRRSIVNMVETDSQGNPLPALPSAQLFGAKQQDLPPMPPVSASATLNNSTTDPSDLYRRIRDTVPSDTFERFADAVAAFNSGSMSGPETIRQVRGWVRDAELVRQFEALVWEAVQEDSVAK
jgi:hypothetical protein